MIEFRRRNSIVKHKKYSIEQIAELILAGHPVILPTETVYGIGVRFDNQNALDNLFNIKNRSIHKPISLHISYEMLQLFDIPTRLNVLCSRIFPGPFTLIIESKQRYGFHSKDNFTNKIGIRVPENKIFQQVIKLINIPICMTSANPSNHQNTLKFEQCALHNIPGIEDDANVSGVESVIIDATTMHVVR
ncbi:MAG: L-threonylcarbamoyladenylate synthase [Alphaproteobacteria bacterium]|nr:MAG: L-threonylcarbamoyladenylate synthase [Alphaproteobacteria bacterium]